MKRMLSFIIAITIFLACNKDEDSIDQNGMTAAYSGTFQRSGMAKSGVMLRLYEGTFEGSSQVDKYPAICRGSYTVSGSTITFIDSCNWTADFDWTLILTGTYSFTSDNGSLRMWRTTGSVTDEYLLNRLTR